MARFKRNTAFIGMLAAPYTGTSVSITFGHYEVSPKTRPHCPGGKFPWDLLMAKLNSTSSSATTSTGSAQKLYRVQIGAFSSKTNADNYLAEAKKKGFDGFIVEVDK